MKAIVLSSLLFLAACNSHDHEEQHHVHQETVHEIANDLKVPLKIWEALEEGAKSAPAAEEGHGGGHGGGEPPPTSETTIYTYAEVKVTLKEKNPGVIKNGEVQIVFPRGGGEIDLADYVLDRRGSFFVTFDFPDFAEAKNKKVLFVSHSRKRKVDGQIFGSGCNAFFDITDQFLVNNGKEGIKVNTTRSRHVSVLGGTFILGAIGPKQNYLTQITFKDRNNSHLLCQEN